MIKRTASAGGVISAAYYSRCMGYRYGLERIWDQDRPGVLFVMLNPSTADEVKIDPTIARCQRRAERLGFGGLRIANLFGFRATDPAILKRAAAPVGAENAGLLADWSGRAGMTIAGWGVHGAHLGQGARVAACLAGDVRHLGLTRDGHPRHPLYVAYDQDPLPWPKEQRYA